MKRGGFRVTPDVAATRWQFQPSQRQEPLDIDDFELLRWVRAQANNPQTLQAACFRRRYERTWVGAEAAAKRVICERGEVLGARAASVATALSVAPAMLLATGGTAMQALGLAIALAIAGTLALLWRGAHVVPRIAIVQAVTMAALVVRDFGLAAGFLMALYVPALAMAASALIGSRIGHGLALLAHARLRERILPGPAAAAAERRSGDAVAA